MLPAFVDVSLTVRLGISIGSYSGYVSSSSGPLAGAVVEAVAGGLIQASVITAPDGSYTLPVAAGTYDLRASGLGYLSQTISAVPAGTTTSPATASFALPRLGAIAGSVEDPTGAPLANAQVLVASATFAGGAVTDSNGQFTTLGLPSG